ncbi:hypothetical protein J2X16_001163 [Pelomonas aquatica]|uniref:Transposase n=1 Tax=Pelomonas aquatica TaxID=431058 RepID=A0ABU1Z5F5_9BURK|nr:hypothetical protein [Pelomonas aquatica]
MFYRWLLGQRQLVPPGAATIKAIDYSLKRWKELTHFVNDGDVPISNNGVENQIRPIAVGRSNWLFAGSLRAGKRAAAIMSLLHPARINGNDPYAYFKDVLDRLPTPPASRIDDLLRTAGHRQAEIAPSPASRIPTPVAGDGKYRRHTRGKTTCVQPCEHRFPSPFIKGMGIGAAVGIQPSRCVRRTPTV